MKSKFYIYVLSAFVFIALGTDISLAQAYTTLKLPRVSDGQMVSIIDFDTDAVIDSLPASNETVVFRSDQYEPAVVKVTANEANYGLFVLNDSPIILDVTVEDIDHGIRRVWKAQGGYNDSIVAFFQHITDLSKELQDVKTDQDRDSINNIISTFLTNKISDNADNILGYRLFTVSESVLPLDNMENLLERHPSLANYKKVNAILASKRNLNKTSTGNKFKDFTISYDGTVHKLSDVVGKGDYVLVDFWAFWCAPCRAEMPYIKEVFNKYKDKDFKVIGVALSDAPEKDLETAAQLELPWDVWVNGYDAGQAYSIKSIPHLILFGPDGTILERGIRGENILPAVSKYLETSN